MILSTITPVMAFETQNGLSNTIGMLSDKGEKNEKSFNNALSPIKNQNYSSKKFTARPLVILMDFPNYKHTDLENKEDWRINAFTGKKQHLSFIIHYSLEMIFILLVTENSI